MFVTLSSIAKCHPNATIIYYQYDPEYPDFDIVEEKITSVKAVAVTVYVTVSFESLVLDPRDIHIKFIRFRLQGTASFSMGALIVMLLCLFIPGCNALLSQAQICNHLAAQQLRIVTTTTRFSMDESDTNNEIVEEDPRLFQKRIRQEQLNAVLQSRSKKIDNTLQQRIVPPQQPKTRKDIVKKRRQGEAASAAMDLPNQPMVTTISGGASTLFESIRNAVVPRWHPVNGVADVNPQFRIASPTMNSAGYAASIWRNARKRQPAMWRYALRTFDRMVEQQQEQLKRLHGGGPKIDIVNTHYEAALVAASKLGWSKRAMEIYYTVEGKQNKILERVQQFSGATSGSTTTSKSGSKSSTTSNMLQNTKISTRITENMVLSVIRASVREAMKYKKREPLDIVLQKIIYSIHEKHNIPITSVHLNPIAAAYQTLGYTDDANKILLGNLLDRIGGPEAENVGIDTGTFNVYDVQAKDKGSYSLLVQSAIQGQDYGQAVQALKTMTEAGLYPTNRHLNIWTEVSNKRRYSTTTTKRQYRIERGNQEDAPESEVIPEQKQMDD